MRLRIVIGAGLYDRRVENADTGEAVDGVAEVQIDPILPDRPVTATVRLYADLDALCEVNLETAGEGE